MPLYEIAGECFRFNPESEYVRQLCAGFTVVDRGQPAFSIFLGNEEIERERLAEGTEGQTQLRAVIESNCILRAVAEYFLSNGKGFLLHASAVKVENKAVVFTGKSGAGKSTHARLWKKLLGEKLDYLNDDKPIIVKKDGKFFAYGTPWTGKHCLGSSDGAQLFGVCEIVKSPENRVEKLDKAYTLAHLLGQTLRPSDEKNYDILLGLLGELIQSIHAIKLFCTVDESAAKLSAREMGVEYES